MISRLLTLALMASQLVMGGGVSVYLCISRDGSHWCLESNPAGCTGCQPEADVDHLAECAHHSEQPGCHSHESSERDDSCPTTADSESCDCTHLLITVARVNTPAVLSHQTTDAGRLCQFPFSELAVAALDRSLPQGCTPAPLGSQTPMISTSAALATLSSVVLRC